MANRHLMMTLCLGFLWACAHQKPLMDVSQLAPLKKGVAVDENIVNEAMGHYPNDATLLAMEEGFALLRNPGLQEQAHRQKAHHYLEHAFYSFENLQDPENLNFAFTPDASVPYKGRPHERVFTATTLAMLDALEGRCDIAFPTLRAAEFLDARWQPFPYGTDAPLVYALMIYCAQQTPVATTDATHAKEGLAVALRLKHTSQTLKHWLDEKESETLRKDALAQRFAYFLFRQAAPGALLQYPHVHEPQVLIEKMTTEASRLLVQGDAFLEKEENQEALSRIAGIAFSGWHKEEKMRQFVRENVTQELSTIERELKNDLKAQKSFARDFQIQLMTALAFSKKIIQQAQAGRLRIHLSGFGPTLKLEGTYEEIARIVAATDQAPIALEQSLSCNTIFSSSDVTAIQLCGKASVQEPSENQTSLLTLWSSSYQGTTVVGRQFDRILKGRAEFKTNAAGISQKATESTFFFFELGTRGLLECIGKTNEDAATAACFVLAGIAISISAISAGVAGTAYFAGAMVNAAADHRFVHSLYENVSVELSNEIMTPKRSQTPLDQQDPSPKLPAQKRIYSK